MLHDEDRYEDPHVFKPERWLGKERDLNHHSLEIVFGFGRRYVFLFHYADADVHMQYGIESVQVEL